MLDRSVWTQEEPIYYNEKVALTVRGLSLADIGNLLRTAEGDMEAAIQSLIADVPESATVDQMIEYLRAQTPLALVQKAMRDSPAGIARIISVAAADGSQDAWVDIISAPAGLQIEAVIKIMELTFVDAASFESLVKKIKAMLPKTIGEAISAAAAPKTASQPEPRAANGSGATSQTYDPSSVMQRLRGTP